MWILASVLFYEYQHEYQDQDQDQDQYQNQYQCHSVHRPQNHKCNIKT